VDSGGLAEGVPLTALGGGGGCGCKIGAGDLLGLLGALPASRDERLLVGAATADDAAVFRLSHDLALVQTIDFFPPPVDDPYEFGRIAAANALSDVYAMGGRPLTALNVVAFPLEALGPEVLAEILRGGAEMCARAGAVVAGGHSIRDEEPKYGLAVTGVVDPARLLTNAGGRVGDTLVLTKPVGVGAVVFAHRRRESPPGLLDRAVEVMTALNDEASEAAVGAGAHALTDVTGFGLLGHLHHLARESGTAAEVVAATVPVLAGVEALLADGNPISGGARRNAEWASGFTTVAPDVAPWRHRALLDPSTSGGLLAALPADRAAAVPGTVVGRLVEGAPGAIRVC
jgi:selenide, water dikinase